jgi:hypothetical protein
MPARGALRGRLQVAASLALARHFGFARREWWAAAPLLAWAGASARNFAVYVADAPYQAS